MKRLLGRLLDVLCFVLAPFFITFGLLDFDKRREAYYYPDDTQIVVAIGVAFVCLGFLRKHWSRSRSSTEKDFDQRET